MEAFRLEKITAEHPSMIGENLQQGAEKKTKVGVAGGVARPPQGVDGTPRQEPKEAEAAEVGVGEQFPVIKRAIEISIIMGHQDGIENLVTKTLMEVAEEDFQLVVQDFTGLVQGKIQTFLNGQMKTLARLLKLAEVSILLANLVAVWISPTNLNM